MADLPLDSDGYPLAAHIARRLVDEQATRTANRDWWSAAAPAYLDEHETDLGAADFLWCPEGVRESEAGLLGPVAGRRVLEIGCGSAPCSRWLAGAGASPVAMDLSEGMLDRARTAGERTGVGVALIQADALALPFGADSFDLVCSAFGGFPFIADIDAALAEVARVLRAGGRLVFSVNHPMRWVLPDDPDPSRLVVGGSYFDRSPYVEADESRTPIYVEHHHTMSDWIRAILGSGLVVRDLLEPEWTPGREVVWGAWSKERAAVLPGTVIFVAEAACRT